MTGRDPKHATQHATARQVLSDLDVAALTSLITDPERTRAVVVVTSGNRAPAQRIDADRIAAEAGPDVEVITLPTGSLTYALERGLPEDTHVFGDAARTYPTGTAWLARPDLAPLRFCRADTDAHRLTAQVIADARAAARHATRPTPAPPSAVRGTATRTGQAPIPARAGITPATLPGAPPRPRPAAPPPASGPAAAPEPPTIGAPVAAGPSPATPPTSAGTPTPANPRGAPPPGRTPTPTGAAPADRPTAGASLAGRGAPRGRLAGDGPWHARTAADGQALAEHLMAAREHPVLVVTTPREDAPPLLDADDLHTRVRQVADVVVLHNGPASWALAGSMPPMTQVYGGAGRVYPIDLGWLPNPYRAPIRFCWLNDDPAQVADQLEDDAFAAANLPGLVATQTAAATLPVTGKVKGFLGRHHATVWLDRRGGDSVLLIDQVYAGVPSARLLSRGQLLAGRIELGLMFPQFLPDRIDDDPAARVGATYSPGDVVLARVTELGARTGAALLHPEVWVSIVADDETDLRNLVTIDQVVTLTILTTDDGVFTAELADADAPSVACLPVLPGGPPWLIEDDLPALEPEPEPEVEAESDTEAAPEPVPAPARATETPPEAPEAGVTDLTPATLGHHTHLAALTAQVRSLTTLLDRERQDARRHEKAATRARNEAQDLRRQLKSIKAQHQAYRDRVEGADLFADPIDQLRYDIGQTWLRRTPEPERATYPLLDYRIGTDFLPSLTALEGISREKVVDVVVEVLTDRAKDIPGRELHPLREHESSQTQRTRADGAKAWRCALQVNTPSARRLHYWRLPDGSIEVDQVGTHDEGL